MTKEKPMVIAPDGTVIQIAHVDSEETACTKCYMYDTCKGVSAGELLRIVGYDCIEEDEFGMQAVWKKVGDTSLTNQSEKTK